MVGAVSAPWPGVVEATVSVLVFLFSASLLSSGSLGWEVWVAGFSVSCGLAAKLPFSSVLLLVGDSGETGLGFSVKGSWFSVFSAI